MDPEQGRLLRHAGDKGHASRTLLPLQSCLSYWRFARRRRKLRLTAIVGDRVDRVPTPLDPPSSGRRRPG